MYSIFFLGCLEEHFFFLINKIFLLKQLSSEEKVY
jgi:hypothetical protein